VTTITATLRGVWAIGTGNEVWAVGEGGKIYHRKPTTGKWVNESGSLTTEDLNAIWGMTLSPELFVVGTNGEVLRNSPGSAPAMPSSPSPADGATGVAMLPLLDWDGGPDGTVSFTVYLNGVPASAGTNSQWQVPMKKALSPNTVHSWKVVARSTAGVLTEGPEWSLTTGTYSFISSLNPATARPTYPVCIYGANFGTTMGKVKVGAREIGLDFGKIKRWDPAEIVIVLPSAIYWTGLPKTFPVSVSTDNGVTWSNVVKLTVQYGGGGTTW
jgi:hypothetical protein